MAAGVGVDDVDGVDAVELVLVQPRGVDVRHPGIEAAAQQRHDAALAEAVLVGPLPFVFELRFVQRLVVGGVQVVHAGGEAGVHDVKILVGQRDIDHYFRLHALDQRDHPRHVVGVDLRGMDRPRDLRRDAPAFLLRAAGERDVGKNLRQLCALVRHHLADAARADDQYFRHAMRSSGRVFRA